MDSVNFAHVESELQTGKFKAALIVTTRNHNPSYFILTPNGELEPIEHEDDTDPSLGRSMHRYNDANREDVILERLRAHGATDGSKVIVAGEVEHESVEKIRAKLNETSRITVVFTAAVLTTVCQSLAAALLRRWLGL
jgi:hypothetical protein